MSKSHDITHDERYWGKKASMTIKYLNKIEDVLRSNRSLGVLFCKIDRHIVGHRLRGCMLELV